LLRERREERRRKRRSEKKEENYSELLGSSLAKKVQS